MSIGFQRNRLGRLFVALVAALTAIALVSTATAGANSGPTAKSKRAHRGKKHKGHGHRYRHKHSGATGSSDEVDPALANAFSVFRTPPEGLPSRAPAWMSDFDGPYKGYGLTPALAQSVQPDPTLPPVLAIPGDGFVCIEVSNGPPKALDPPLGINGAACTSTDRAIAHGVGLIVINNEGTWSASFGLVPDGVASVAPKGNPNPVPVLDNVFAGLGQWLN